MNPTKVYLSLVEAQVLIGFLSHMKTGEIAKQMGLTRDAVCKVMSRLKQRFGVASTERMLRLASRSRSVVDFVPVELTVEWPGKAGAVKIL